MKYLLVTIGFLTIGMTYNSLSVVEQVNHPEVKSHLVCVKPVVHFECDRNDKCIQVLSNEESCYYK